MTSTRTWRRIIGGGGATHNAARVLVRDGYSSPRGAVTALLAHEHLRRRVWEPAAGLHAIVDPLVDHGHSVFTSDVVQWHTRTRVVRSFFDFDAPPTRYPLDLVTNPPYGRVAQPFVEHAIDIMPVGSLVCMLLKLSFLEGGSRYHAFRRSPPLRVWVFSRRLPRMHRFDYDGPESGGMLSFGWFVWQVGHHGPTTVDWISPRHDMTEHRPRIVVQPGRIP